MRFSQLLGKTWRSAPAELTPLTKVATPDCKTIAAVADFLGVPTSQTMMLHLAELADYLRAHWPLALTTA